MARDRGFGYIQPPVDGRNFKFLAMTHKAEIAEAAKPTPRKRAYSEGPRLDQGNKPHCTGFAAKGFLNAAPMMSKNTEEPTPLFLYQSAQKHDEWPGENYDGSSVKGVCEAMKACGLIESYLWFTKIDQLIEWLNGGYGTVLVGSNWYAAMDNVDAKGYIQFPGTISTPIGGHAYRINWYDKAKGAFLVVNSWGDGWGMTKRTGGFTGTAYLKPEHATQLFFTEDGECAAPTQVRLTPKAVVL